jgi:hypothetical protein
MSHTTVWSQEDIAAYKLKGVPAKRLDMVQLTERGGNWL